MATINFIKIEQMFDWLEKICYYECMSNAKAINMFDDDLELSLNLDDDFQVPFEKLLNKSFSSEGLTVCFSGSRPTALPWKYNEECELCQKFKVSMLEIIDKLYDAGFRHFITGLALGFDTIMTELLLKKRAEKKIFIECAIPCKEQTTFWRSEDKVRYNSLLNQVDKITYTSQEYHGGVYKIRNKYMIDNSNLLVAVQFKESRGTAATIELAASVNLPRIIFH